MTSASKPLAGCRVLVTRARAQSAELIDLLEKAGGEVVTFAAIEIGPPPSWESLDAVVNDLAVWGWIVFTSRNGVDAFFERLDAKGQDASALRGVSTAAVGRATAAALRARGVEPDAMPEKARSAEIAAALPGVGSGSRVAVVRALAGRDELLDDLRARGAAVHLATAYETHGAESMPDELRHSLARGEIHVLTFTSPSTVESVLRHLTDDERARVIAHASFVAIGPTTTAALEASGAEGIVQANEATMPSLAEAVVEAWSQFPSPLGGGWREAPGKG